MKIYWSAFLSLLFLLALAGCGAEQFGTAPTSTAQPADPLKVYQQSSCSGHTLIKPEVDILYVVDNSTSFNWISDSVKAAIQGTINSISTQFDYRIIATPLSQTANGNEQYQVLAENPSSLPSSVGEEKKVTLPNQFVFFPVPGKNDDPLNPANPFEEESGLKRTTEFVAHHSSSLPSQEKLFRRGAHLLIVLISNGKDYEIERTPANGGFSQSAFNSRRTSLLGLKTYLDSQQLRLFTVTANDKTLTSCPSGSYSSKLSYGNMSQSIHQAQTNTYVANADHFDLYSTSVSNVFSQVNSTIKQTIIPHIYEFWPITSTDGVIDPNSIRVFKSSPTQAPTELTSGWSYQVNPNYPGAHYTRVDENGNPMNGAEQTSRKHLIKFSSGSFIKYPDCVSITTASNTEYFGYVVIPKIPEANSEEIKINGNVLPKSAYTYIGQQTRNIKVAHNGYLATPEVTKSGYMFQLNSSHYYKSGDNVEIFYVPKGN